MKATFEGAVYLDLLDSSIHNQLLAEPSRLEQFIPAKSRPWVIIDEVQRIPDLLNEVHRLIESRRLKFVLTGSSARGIRKRGVNLLAGRALTRTMHPLTAREAGSDFDLVYALEHGTLPSVFGDADPASYLASYVHTYLREEVQQEGLTRSLSAFSRFLEAASFSQASVLNIAAVSRECAVERKVVENYFTILEDLLLAHRIPVFRRRSKRRMVAHPKFFFFDVGVYQTLRPKGPLDGIEEIRGAALETLVLQELLAHNAYADLGYTVYYWRASTGLEVDFVLYGPRGIKAIEVKLASRLRKEDLRGLRAFRNDYPQASTCLLYCGSRRLVENDTEIIPVTEALQQLPEWLES